METFPILLMVAAFAAWGWGIGDAISRPDSDWREIGKDRTVWVLIQVFAGVLGPLLYFALVRPPLVEAAKSRQAR